MKKNSVRQNRKIVCSSVAVNGCAAAIAVLAMLFGASARGDDFIVYSPYVTQGQNEIELRGFSYNDPNVNINGGGGYEVAIAHAVTSWWKPELYIGRFEMNPGAPAHFAGYEFENTFQLTEPGEYWADIGMLASYEYNQQPGIPDALEFGPLIEKRSGRIDQRLNLIWEKEVGVGSTANYAFRAAYTMNYQINTQFAPGFEAYYRPGDHAYQIGPDFSGELAGASGKEFEYSVGMVFGVNQDAPDQTLIVRLEYEFF
ncbi:MAG: hypothetical protein ACYCSS_06445 [Sulfuriferula sp.]